MDESQEEVRRKAVLDRVEWCCPNRHGVIRGVTREESRFVSNTLNYYFAGEPRKGQWWKRNPQNEELLDVEFVHMAKVYPPPKNPWEWCGKTLLFEKGRNMAELRRRLASTFNVGDTVKFTFQGIKKTGIIARKVKRATVIVPGERIKYYVPFTDLDVVD